MFNIIAIIIFSLGISIVLGYFFINVIYKLGEKDDIKFKDRKED